jgi:hypothetical protein
MKADITGLLAAVAQVRPDLRGVLRTASSAHSAATALSRANSFGGRARYRTRSLPSTSQALRARANMQPRDARGRFCRAAEAA